MANRMKETIVPFYMCVYLYLAKTSLFRFFQLLPFVQIASGDDDNKCNKSIRGSSSYNNKDKNSHNHSDCASLFLLYTKLIIIITHYIFAGDNDDHNSLLLLHCCSRDTLIILYYNTYIKTPLLKHCVFTTFYA